MYTKAKHLGDMERLNRGDMIRKHNKHKNEYILSPAPKDRGDAKRNKKQSNQELKSQPKKAESLKMPIDLVSRSTNTLAESAPLRLENPDKINMDFSPNRSAEYRKRIKDRYTFRRYKEPRDGDNISKIVHHGVKNELPRQSRLDTVQRESEAQEIKKSEIMKDRSINRAVSAMKTKPKTKSDKSDLVDKKVDSFDDKNSVKTGHRKPMIKTITSKMDTRVYKAVTFVDQKQQRKLQIKIPNKEIPTLKTPTKIPRAVRDPIDKTRQDQTQVKKRLMEQVGKRRVYRRETRTPSPTKKSVDSLPVPTEVAKWAPESTNQYTMPYYEAWVNKTLTAIPKYSKKDEIYLEKSRVLQALRELEQRNKSPKLVYRVAEEKYAGRIRIRQKPKEKL